MKITICFYKCGKKLRNRLARKPKVLIDIAALIAEYDLDTSSVDDAALLNSVVCNRITLANDLERDIYYVPNFYSPNLEIAKLLAMKPVFSNREFNLLLNQKDFIGTYWYDDLVNSEAFDDVTLC